MGFSRQEYWSGWPFPTPGDRPSTGTQPPSLAFPALQADSLLQAPPGPIFLKRREKKNREKGLAFSHRPAFTLKQKTEKQLGSRKPSRSRAPLGSSFCMLYSTSQFAESCTTSSLGRPHAGCGRTGAVVLTGSLMRMRLTGAQGKCRQGGGRAERLAGEVFCVPGCAGTGRMVCSTSHSCSSPR